MEDGLGWKPGRLIGGRRRPAEAHRALPTRRERIEPELLPGLDNSVRNLFWDLLVNEVVGRTHADDLVHLYAALAREFAGQYLVSAPMYFYFAIYEELWKLPHGTLANPALDQAIHEAHPSFREDVRIFVATFYGLVDVRLQFIYFCGCLSRYLPPGTIWFELDPLSRLLKKCPLAPGPTTRYHDVCPLDRVERQHAGRRRAAGRHVQL
ncbi:MAG: hypothetical protein FJZ01_15960, partial [Candidatus Sericytochromatia bacterium]|nr:hypothetical protein [Candidatus Tanganyikabacteria bacterium]